MYLCLLMKFGAQNIHYRMIPDNIFYADILILKRLKTTNGIRVHSLYIGYFRIFNQSWNLS